MRNAKQSPVRRVFVEREPAAAKVAVKFNDDGDAEVTAPSQFTQVYNYAFRRHDAQNVPLEPLSQTLTEEADKPLVILSP